MQMPYVHILIFAVLAILVGVVPVLLAWFIADHQPNDAKSKPFECGFSPDSGMRVPFDIRYYLIAILFILFDLETAFLLPWAVCLDDIGYRGFALMMVFLGVLVVGFIYEWQVKALEWKSDD
ncbi:NADH-quinone oxidoreductase subunit A [Gammaproteobacteria bacterium]|nr:NADH-quinone oxidoreductase subunit A [Gammaproteobacteria bacterium]